MGIPWPDTEFGNDCACYAPGKTPVKMWCSIAGVKKCFDANPPFDSPNGVHELSNAGGPACIWSGTTGNWFIEFRARQAGTSTLTAFHNFGAFGFTSFELAECRFSFSGMAVCNPGNPFILWGSGGAALMASGNSPNPSLQDFAGLFNLAADNNAMADFWPIDLDQQCIRYANQKTPTNILMKVSLSEFDQFRMFDW